ncbi:MAG: uroporphyrinogen decarboxylase family protein [Kosmotogaceae bacterium]
MGVIYARPPSSIYFDTVRNPLSEVTCIDDVRDFPWPDPEAPSRLCGLERKISGLKASFAVILTPFLPGVFETLISLCGYERTMAGLIEDRSLFQYIIDRIVEIKCSFYRSLGRSITDIPDIVFETDDLGTQNGPLISPGMYRECFLPAHRRIIGEIKKSLPGVRVLLHSCGSIRWALPMLIDAGVDIINPVQPGAKDMDLKELKREFGDSVVFWGASVDPQKTLVTKTPQMIEREVREHIETLSVNGGFVLATVHNIQPDVPDRNLLAFLEAIERYR